MKQPHTETAVDHTDDQQNTGNHLKPGSGALGSDKIGGTRAGAENVEPVPPVTGGEAEKANPEKAAKAGHAHAVLPERDEHGRL